jgi:phosphotransferase system  glucose/maltose/N-acetylglucosamine-specific IIC component
MVFDADGNLVIDQGGTWGGEPGTSVVLKPSGGTGCFIKGVTYNILVYPGVHTSFSVPLIIRSTETTPRHSRLLRLFFLPSITPSDSHRIRS